MKPGHEETNGVTTYDDIHCLIKVNHNALLIDDGNGGDRAFGKHMNNVKNRGIKTGSGNWMVRILAFK